MALTIYGAQAAVSLVNRALFNTSPSNSVYLNQVATAGTSADSEYAFANKLGASLGNKSAAELTALIFANMGVNNKTVNQESFSILEAAVTDYIAFHGTQNIGIIALQLGQLLSNLDGDATFGAAATAWNKEVVGAYQYSSNPANTSEQTDDVVAGNTFTLTVGQDGLTGTGNDDTFKANVVQNTLGQQVNTLGSGDELNGGQGYDTLVAKVTSGVFAGGTSNMAIQPDTRSVESIKLEAVWNGASNSVFINAKDMVDVTYLGSEASDADLTILNMTTRRGNEVKAEGDLNGKLAETTIGMKYTNNQGTGSDLTVKYDQDYLVGATSAVDGYYYDLLDQAAYDLNSNTPLAGFPLTGVNFTLTTGANAQAYSLVLTKEEMTGISTHAELVQLLNQKLAETYPTLQNLTFKLQGQFSDTEGLRTSDRIALVDTDSGDRTVSGGNIVLDTAQGAGNLYWDQGPVDRVTTPIPVSIKIELEKVGLAGEGGALVIGSMNDGGGNVFNPSNITTTTDTVSGIEEFNVTVVGDKSKSSSLTGLHSTNNNLRTVNVISTVQNETAADLTIGNTNSGLAGGNQGALKDVKTFDASAFKGDLTLHAALTNEVVAKYLDLKDVSPAEAAADNAAFMYTGGTGNDTIDLQVSSDNLATLGTATREDMSVSIAGGAGNDTITLSVVSNNSSVLAAGNQAWYANQKLNANLSINAGEGNDTIWTPGSGDVRIDAGGGNDTVYSENTGAKAAWVFNALDDSNAANTLNNIVSSANNSYTLYKTNVLVTFKGFEAVAAVVDVQGGASDLAINQAIKKAINENPVLSKLLLAEDGPANTLVITSLIDGEVVAGDLVAELVAPDPAGTLPGAANPYAQLLTTADGTLLTNWGISAADVTTAVGVFNTNAANEYNQEFAYDGAARLEGAASAATNVSVNTITAGAGDDVLVLSTSDNGRDILVYNGYGNGTDSIVNFTADDLVTVAAADFIDFSSYGAVGLYLGGVVTAGVYDGATATLQGTAAVALGDKYITVIESTTNAGSYLVQEWTEAGALGFAGDTVQTIGVLDFGDSVTFDPTTFAI